MKQTFSEKIEEERSKIMQSLNGEGGGGWDVV